MKEKYDGAIKVDFDPRGKMITVDNLQKKPTKSSLIYFEDSPDGCVLDYSRGHHFIPISSHFLLKTNKSKIQGSWALLRGFVTRARMALTLVIFYAVHRPILPNASPLLSAVIAFSSGERPFLFNSS